MCGTMRNLCFQYGEKKKKKKTAYNKSVKMSVIHTKQKHIFIQESL